MPALRSLIVLLTLAAFITSVPACWATPNNSAAPIVKKAEKKPDFLSSLDKSDEPKEKSEPVFVTALGFIARLAFVLMLAYCTIWGLKKFTGGRGLIGIGRQRIKVIENTNLAANRSLHLIEIGSKSYLVASTPNQVSLIAEIAKEDIPEGDTPEPTGGFGQQLASFLGQKPDTTWAASSVADMLRESTTYLQDKVREVGGFRRKLKDA